MSAHLGMLIHERCVKLLKKNKHVHNRTIIIDFEAVLNNSALLKTAKAHDYYIFIITNRPPSEWKTITNALNKSKLPYTSVFTSAYVDEHPILKIDIRDRLKLTDPSMLDKNKNTVDLLTLSSITNKPQIHNTTSVVLCIGDSWLDILGKGSFLGVKLSHPDDNHIYLYKQDKKITRMRH
jgi:hypothetical protein